MTAPASSGPGPGPGRAAVEAAAVVTLLPWRRRRPAPPPDWPGAAGGGRGRLRDRTGAVQGRDRGRYRRRRRRDGFGAAAPAAPPRQPRAARGRAGPAGGPHRRPAVLPGLRCDRSPGAPLRSPPFLPHGSLGGVVVSEGPFSFRECPGSPSPCLCWGARAGPPVWGLLGALTERGHAGMGAGGVPTFGGCEVLHPHSRGGTSWDPRESWP